MSEFDMYKQDIRQPAVAGQFYPRDAGALRATIERSFLAPLGPGAVPTVEAGPRHIVGLVAPHAGYPYSGQCAAWAYAALARDGRPAAAVILGVNHRGIGQPLALSPAHGWRTPLGVMPVANELADRLRELDPELIPDARAHALEHSLEVHMPFLQFLYGELPILPISIGLAPVSMITRLGHALATLARTDGQTSASSPQGGGLVLIASTDFSHYVTRTEAEWLDRLALEQIAAVNPTGLITVVRERGISMCGVLPVATMLTAAGAMGIQQGEILHYHTSGDVTGERQEVVGYGAAVLAQN